VRGAGQCPFAVGELRHGVRDHVEVLFRPATHADLDGLVAVQEEGAVAALAHVFPQDRHPFPREAIRQRWSAELQDPAVSVYVSTDDEGEITGFAARRGDELLHFGTAMSTWGTGLAGELHNALIATYPADLARLRLRVFAENHRARRFWEKHGWHPTGRASRSPFAPHPILVEYELRRGSRSSS
jgi:RimJ/RimL family protein N-acetyltransferase